MLIFSHHFAIDFQLWTEISRQPLDQSASASTRAVRAGSPLVYSVEEDWIWLSSSRVIAICAQQALWKKNFFCDFFNSNYAPKKLCNRKAVILFLIVFWLGNPNPNRADAPMRILRVISAQTGILAKKSNKKCAFVYYKPDANIIVI